MEDREKGMRTLIGQDRKERRSGRKRRERRG